MRAPRGALWFVVAAVVCSCGPGKPKPRAPLITEQGTPSGEAVQATLGPAGGSLASADATFTLTVPPGALTTSTVVSIQPISNHAPGGLGAALRLTPEGQTFDSPVTLTFHYAEADLAGTALEALGVAYQDEQGRWRSLNAVARDAEARTLTVTTTHFSDWSRVSGFQLRPPMGAVDLERQLMLEVDFCQTQQVTDELYTLLAACEANELFPVTRWSVNGISGGNQSVGSVDEVAPGAAVYTAPARKPASNPVAVSAETTVGRTRIVLVANINVGKPSKWVGTVKTEFTDDEPGVSSLSMQTFAEVTFTWEDAASEYVPAGTVTFDYLLRDLANGCRTVAHASALIGPQDGKLSIMGTEVDGQYLYVGSGLVPQTVNGTWTCPDSPAETTFVAYGIFWWNQIHDFIRADGTIDGSTPAPDFQSWHFDPVP